MTKYVKVKRHKRSLHKDCMRCGKDATVTATHVNVNGMRMDVMFCEGCAREGGVI